MCNNVYLNAMNNYWWINRLWFYPQMLHQQPNTDKYRKYVRNLLHSGHIRNNTFVKEVLNRSQQQGNMESSVACILGHKTQYHVSDLKQRFSWSKYFNHSQSWALEPGTNITILQRG